MDTVHAYFARSFKDPQLAPHVEALSLAMGRGHLCVTLSAEEANALSGSFWVSDAGTETDKPFVLHNHRLYYQRYFRYQQTILDFATERWAEDPTGVTEQTETALETLFSGNSKGTAQKNAVKAALQQSFFLLTGGPGTGKTTTLARLLYLKRLANPKLRISLAAPTGKAAARMKESLRNSSTGLLQPLPDGRTATEHFARLDPQTVHSLLGPLPQSHYFRYDATHPLPAELVVVDEASMLDAALMAKLMQALSPDAQLILLGDRHQLASVEAGSVFGDLCLLAHAYAVNPPIAELTHSYRFAADKGIGRFSRAILNNDAAALEAMMGQQQEAEITFVGGERNLRNPALERFAAGFEEYVQLEDTAAAILRFNSRCRLLCLTREGPSGMYEANRLVENYLQEKGLIRRSPDFYENQPVLVTQNLHEHHIYNGDVGLIRPNAKGQLAAWFLRSDGQLYGLPPGLLPPVETAFAMTIHKSQGSEFDEVYLALPHKAGGQLEELLTRELIYTAATRAKSRLYVHSPPELLLGAAGRKVERASGIG